ncbi:MAG: DEAD/DEAH box helicase [Planctomycetaceae bacterium]|nr:DEAD/DEAH box helicase [Planctomycetaceae bacterium]
MPLDNFHPLVREWFSARFGEPTEPQRMGWPHISAGRHTLIAAPTGSGKTLAAFLVCLNRLWQDWLDGKLTDGVRVVYVSPLKALSNDIERNLQQPLAELCELALQRGILPPPIRTAVRTGDTPSATRQKMLRVPPHILVTTPESLYLMLTSEKSREVLRTVDTVIVDEIHALARDKRGSHLSLTLERLADLCENPPVRIGLSATQRPIEDIARFLVGTHANPITHVETPTVDHYGKDDSGEDVFLVDGGHSRDLDLAVEVPPSELSAVCSNEQWGEVYERLVELIQSHRSTLIFVNTRRLAERVSHHLREVLGDDAVAGHHGSLAKELRHSAEQRLKNGELKAIVATASLEMGIDVGYIDLVCQVGSPRAIATFLQRVGRSGHSLGLTPKGRLFPLTRDELLECMSLVRAVRRGELDRIEIPNAPLDILAQQIVATVACDEWEEDSLFELCRRAWPYRHLSRKQFDEVVEMLASGMAAGTKRGLHLHRDRINGRVRARRGARLAAITSGGAIPDTAEYRVVTEPDKTFVGNLDEDFAIESMAGDVFLLGNTSWRVQQVRSGEVIVRDAEGAPPSVPFWFGEGPGRTIELSAEVSRLRRDIAVTGLALREECGVSTWAAEQATNYIESQVAAIGLVPTTEQIVFERFFDESGGMQLVIHSPFGARINRAWGLALRKRFCRSFDFELQAAATDNGIVLSLSSQHSFPIDSLFKMLGPHNAKYLLEQAVLAAPMFQVRWRWNVTRALAVLRRQGGKKVPPHLLRFRSDDLLASAFPETVGCLENHHGDVEIPDHPLVQQTMHDCLTEAMDVERWVNVLQAIKDNKIELVARDTREPSPFSHELLNANPYAFLDGAPLEERRTRAVSTRRSFTADDVRDLAQLDPAAIDQVRAEAWPIVRDADELHEALLTLVTIPANEASSWQTYFDELRNCGRASTVNFCDRSMWIAAESLPLVQAVYDGVAATPEVRLPPALDKTVERTDGLVELVRGRMQIQGPTTAAELAIELALEPSSVSAALEALEGQGVVLRGQFTDGARLSSGSPNIEWCDRRLLTRIHRLTLDGLRQKIKPVTPEDFMRFLLRRHRLSEDSKWGGAVGVREAIAQLQGFEIPAGVWETKILAARCQDYDSQWLDHLFMAGEVAWGRLRAQKHDETSNKVAAAMSRAMPISLAVREDLPWLLSGDRDSLPTNISSNGEGVLAALSTRGALFFQELKAATKQLPSHIEDALRELATLGLVTCDMFAAVRAISSKHLGRRAGRRRTASSTVAAPAGRWSLFPGLVELVSTQDRLERWCHLLLRRYGVVFRDLLTRESTAPPWHELVRVFRRLELRGVVRGGRFITGVGGEQFAEEAAIGELRAVRETGSDESWFVISAVDPLNLAGIITTSPRVTANSNNSLILKDGKCVAAKQSDRIEFYEEFPLEIEAEMRRSLQIGKREANSHVRSAWIASDRKPRQTPELTAHVPSRSLRQT